MRRRCVTTPVSAPATSKTKRSYCMTGWTTPLDVNGRKDDERVRRRIGQGQYQHRRGLIVADLSLGFGRFLYASRHYTSLWAPSPQLDSRRCRGRHPCRGVTIAARNWLVSQETLSVGGG